MELPGVDHFYFVESTLTISAISQFCQEQPAEAQADTSIGIVLYLCLPRIKQAERVIQTELNAYQAKGVFFLDDEVTAVFHSPSRAIQCALKLRDTIKGDFLRISLHVGECRIDDGKPSHAVIDVARRAAEFVPQEKILLTQTLHDIMAGSGVVFDLRKIHVDEQKTESVSFYALTSAFKK